MQLLSGNEAIARGAWEAGATIGAAYPGTPSTETMENFARYEDVYAEWCTNEKVALEVALGASAGGARVLVTMKHVGMNVAADPLFTAAYTGVGGGVVVLAADDPSMYSSQNEQDSHYYGAAAHVPVLDPSDAAEALAFTRSAYELSERFDVPVIIRSSVRISHTKTPVELGQKQAHEPADYQKDPAKWVMMPAFAKPRRQVQLARIDELTRWAASCEFNRTELRGREVGVVCAGAAYQHVREALPDASVLKLGVTWPLSPALLQEFAREVHALYVVEEGSEYLLQAVRACGARVSEFPCELPRFGELSPQLIRRAFGMCAPVAAEPPAAQAAQVAQVAQVEQAAQVAQVAQVEQAAQVAQVAASDLPARPPALCPGCPHRGVFRELARLKAIVTGDIGCYTLGALPPLSAMDTCVDMGASVSMSHGLELAFSGREHRPVVAVIGDSTFAHSGLSSLVSTVYNQGAGTVCILDNRTTAMTGRQGNPFNGETLQHRESRELDLMGLLDALGVAHVREVDPLDVGAVRVALREATGEQANELSVIVFKSPCVLLTRQRAEPYFVNDACIACGACISVGCPALSKDRETGIAAIDVATCIGCGLCAQYCPSNAIEVVA